MVTDAAVPRRRPSAVKGETMRAAYVEQEEMWQDFLKTEGKDDARAGAQAGAVPAKKIGLRLRRGRRRGPRRRRQRRPRRRDWRESAALPRPTAARPRLPNRRRRQPPRALLRPPLPRQPRRGRELLPKYKLASPGEICTPVDVGDDAPEDAVKPVKRTPRSPVDVSPRTAERLVAQALAGPRPRPRLLRRQRRRSRPCGRQRQQRVATIGAMADRLKDKSADELLAPLAALAGDSPPMTPKEARSAGRAGAPEAVLDVGTSGRWGWASLRLRPVQSESARGMSGHSGGSGRLRKRLRKRLRRLRSA